MLLHFPTLIVCTIVGSCLAQEWSIYNYPDPILNPELCGRPSPSFVCDPDSVLPDLDVQLIDELGKSLFNETTVACRYDTEGLKRSGYLIMVAAMNKMVRTYTTNQTNTQETRFAEARFFSYVLGRYKWTNHSCDATIVILYSAEDGVIYTSTQPAARARLTDEIVLDYAWDILFRFYPIKKNRQKAAEAIKYLVSRYSNICNRLSETNAPEHRVQTSLKRCGLKARLGMSVTTQGGSGRQFVTGP